MTLEKDVIEVLGGIPLGNPNPSRLQPTPKLVNSDLSRNDKVRFYHHKITQKGKYFELFQCERPVFYNFKPSSSKKIKLPDHMLTEIELIKRAEKKEENRKRNAHRSRRKFIDLCMSNFSTHDKFLTLTFKDTYNFDITNIKECNKLFSLFIRRLRKHVPKLKYIASIEFQDKEKRGAVHYHLICNLPYIHWSKLTKIWSHGSIDIQKPKKMDDIFFYLPKYFTKNSTDERFKGHRTFYYSKNLKKPKVIKGEFARQLGIKIIKNYKQIGKTEEYTSDLHGKIIKKLYTYNNFPAKVKK